MKNLFTLFSLWMMSCVAFSQNYYVFSDKDGNVFDDGVTIVRTDTEELGPDMPMVPSGLYVKNVEAPSNYEVSVQANIERIDSGELQLCFPQSCSYYNTTGKQNETGRAIIEQGNVQNLMTEWVPREFGECIVTYTLKMYQSFFSKGERTITVHFKYLDPAGITQPETNTSAAESFFDMQGRRAEATTRGLSIIRMSDGSVKKVIRM